MCGRARCSLAPQQAAAAAGVPEERWLDRDLYRPSHNLAPGAYLPTVELAHLGSVQEASGAAHGSGGAAEGAASAGAGPQLQMRTMAWGLVPSYTKPPPGGQRPSAWDHFNARSEAVSEGDGWGAVMRRLLARNRCVVLADGFYEWRKEGARKQPYYVHMKDGQVRRAMLDMNGRLCNRLARLQLPATRFCSGPEASVMQMQYIVSPFASARVDAWCKSLHCMTSPSLRLASPRR